MVSRSNLAGDRGRDRLKRAHGTGHTRRPWTVALQTLESALPSGGAFSLSGSGEILGMRSRPQTRLGGAAIMSETTYSVVVRDANSWSASTGVHQELANCGHHHKSITTAQGCLERLTAWHCLCGRTTSSYAPCCHTPHNSTSARWYHARIEDSNGEIIERYERIVPNQPRLRSGLSFALKGFTSASLCPRWQVAGTSVPGFWP